MSDLPHRRALREHWPVALYAALIVLLPFGRAGEAAVIAAVVVGSILLLGRPQLLRAPGTGLAWGVFAGYWLAALLSAPHAVAPAKTWSTVAVDLRFAPFVLLAVAYLTPPRLRRLYAIAAAVAVLWAFDALVQAASGHSLGGALDADRVSGVFGADNLKLGPALVVLAPFALEQALARYGRTGFALLWLLFALAVLLAGERAGWVGLGVVSAYYAVRLARGGKQLALGALAAIAAATALGGAAYVLSERFAARVDRTLVALEGDRAAIDHALAGRLPIWRTALAMGADHPLNGVGVRGFRYAYARYAAADDPWVDPVTGEGALHPHQILLELWAETGLLGLLCWLAALVFALRAWQRADAAARERARLPGLALAVMCFPLNTHFAFYSNHWAIYFWWLLALFCAALAPERRPDAST